MTSTVNGSYIYNQVFPLIDYCGDIRAMEKNGSSGGYSPEFSPNNIRRLIISPDAVLCHYHMTLGKLKSLADVVHLAPQVLARCETMPDYKPIVGVLATSRICASVEEVIFLTRSNDGSVCLADNELDFDSLVKSFKRQGSLEDTVKGRYKRLHDFTIVNMSYNEFMTRLRQEGNVFTFICDLAFMQSAGANVKIVHDEEEWYKSWGSSAQAYKPDGIGKDLHTYFSNIVQKYEDRKKSNDLQKFKDERVKGLEADFEKAYSLYKRASKCYIQITKASSLMGTNVLFNHPLEKLKPPALYECGVLKGRNVGQLVQANSEKEALTENTKILKAFVVDIHDCLMMFLLKNLTELCQTRPVTANVVVRTMEPTLKVPALCRDYAAQIKAVTGVDFNGQSLKTSLINVSWYCANILFSKSGKRFSRGEENRGYWEDLLA